MTEPLERVRRVKRAHEARWLALEGVAAVGIGQSADGAPRIVVSVEADSARIRGEIPDQVEGVPVGIQVSGPLRAL